LPKPSAEPVFAYWKKMLGKLLYFLHRNRLTVLVAVYGLAGCGILAVVFL